MKEKEFSMKPFNHEEEDLYSACGLTREKIRPTEDAFLEKIRAAGEEIKTSIIVESIDALEVPSRVKVLIAMKAQKVLSKALVELARDSLESTLQGLFENENKMPKSKIAISPYDHHKKSVVEACGLDLEAITEAQLEIIEPLPDVISLSHIIEAIEKADVPLRAKLGMVYRFTRHTILSSVQGETHS